MAPRREPGAVEGGCEDVAANGRSETATGWPAWGVDGNAAGRGSSAPSIRDGGRDAAPYRRGAYEGARLAPGSGARDSARVRGAAGPAQPRLGPASDPPQRRGHSEDDGTTRHGSLAAGGPGESAGGLRRADHAGRAPHADGLRPLRRPAGGPGTVDEQPVDARAARRAAGPGRARDLARPGRRETRWRVAALRAFYQRRQGPHHRRAGGAGRAARLRHDPLGQPQAVPRGRGGGRLAAPGIDAVGARRPAEGGPVGLLRRPRASEPPPAAVLGCAGRDGPGDDRVRPTPIAAQRPLRQLGAQSCSHPRPPGRQPARDRRSHPDRVLL